MRHVKIIVTGTAALIGFSASAAEPKFELTPWLGAATGGSFEEEISGAEIDVGDTQFGALTLHLESRNGGQYELYYSRQDTELETAGFLTSTPLVGLRVEYLQFGGTYVFENDNSLEPYILLTIGASRFSPNGPGLDDETFFSATGGGGLRFHLTKRLALKLEARALMSLVDSDSDVFCESNFGEGLCEISVTGDSLLQWTANAGIAFRF
ncbi:MAG: porin family protein [Gammaproteobacteria bacterium]|nr:porin family protein [Gammaproteobacteria bacterium]MBT8111684.1 porin family protein [Gammaproteobacteria bacterium]NND46862.1 porin family protein [Woeseiaceae bacterium]NNL46382.1 porin family protein [Woeseiaceae bacterium]